MSNEETITLDIEEQNELSFKVQIEGTDPSPAKVRMVCESIDGLSYMFEGHSTGQDLVEFIVPPMDKKLKEGQYSARLEVLVENRYFSPVQFDLNFKKTMKVVAESMGSTSRPVQPVIRVSATPVIKPVAPPVEQPRIAVQPSPQRPTETQPRRPVTAAPAVPMKKSPRHYNTSESLDEDIREIARELVGEIMSRKGK